MYLVCRLVWVIRQRIFVVCFRNRSTKRVSSRFRISRWNPAIGELDPQSFVLVPWFFSIIFSNDWVAFADFWISSGKPLEKKILDCQLRIAEIRPVRDKTTYGPLPLLFSTYKGLSGLRSVKILGAWYNPEICWSTWYDVNKQIPTIPDIYTPCQPMTTCGI